MKKQGKEITPDDYKKLLREISELKKLLSQERLRADFYEEMVAFGKEVYGIDPKYASYTYTARLKRAGVSISMTEYGNPRDNAVAERVNNTIKNELFKGMEFHSIGEVRQALKVAVDFYYNERPHWSLDGMTPVQAGRMKGEIQKKWTSFREIAIKRMQI